MNSQAIGAGQLQPAHDLQSVAASRGELVLRADELSKDFKLGRGQILHAVRDVSFGLYKSAVVALVGESGSGKSTVARMLAGQESVSSGKIWLNGEAVQPSRGGEFRRYKSEVQLVFQDPFSSLNPAHTVRYDIERPLRLHHHSLSREQVREAAVDLMQQVRLTPPEKFLASYPHELSGGQRQRVSFARALAAQPRVLLADEPVSMLDVSIRLEMLSLLDDLRTSFSLAMLYITHDIASARYFADEVLVMYAGQIVERGAAEDVTQQPAHPYTQLLVSSAPDPDNLGGGLRELPGESGAGTGSATEIAGRNAPVVIGCPFSDRCPFVADKCRAENPPLLQLSASRAAACWRLDVAAPAVLAGREGGDDLTN